ncbi:hypothetical protein [Chondromyces crocatus]|uniref:Uncharacterized protein n=1 Tax=Chondromyces crocatus TaxID=52 RepID=A0A0K1EC72_CHOCO|nr:hypothetical protein [Chondromyces crocatus]AKT38470.1 uncharacterized protein CMC5_026170 [Chondromyces crocatus]
MSVTAGVVVFVFRRPASEAVWASHVARVQSALQHSRRGRVLLASRGEMPGPTERQHLAPVLKAIGPGTHKMAFVGDGTYTHGMMKGMIAMEFASFGWNVQLFTHDHLPVALDFLDLSPSQQGDVTDALRSLLEGPRR